MPRAAFGPEGECRELAQGGWPWSNRSTSEPAVSNDGPELPLGCVFEFATAGPQTSRSLHRGMIQGFLVHTAIHRTNQEYPLPQHIVTKSLSVTDACLVWFPELQEFWIQALYLNHDVLRDANRSLEILSLR